MSNDLTKAIKLLEIGEYTCILCKGDTVLTSTERGVKPLIEWLDSGEDLSGFSAADKVVGRAAAFLYALLGVKEVFAPVMSEGAVYTLARHGITPVCNATAKKIINRAGTGICPMEEAVTEISDPQEALASIRTRLKELSMGMALRQKNCAV